MRGARLLISALLLGGATCAAAGLFDGGALTPPALAAEPVFHAPPPKLDAPSSAPKATAIFAGGCFWAGEGVFSHVKGVKSVITGYSGGSKANADYGTVSRGGTGHAESVKVVYDPHVVSYGDLMQIFFSVIADPTTRNYQGPDHGTQYRSALFPLTGAQAKAARAYLRQLDASGVYKGTVVTDVEHFGGFYPAESYHQDFMARNPDHPYIVRWDEPKVMALKAMFPERYQSRFVKG